MRYIDDLLLLNNSGFAHTATDIYPSELVLKRTTESPMELSYLDLLITIDSSKYSTTTYDKRDSSNFNIVNFPHMTSLWSVYISQLVRMGRICSSFGQFKDKLYKLTSKLMEQGFNIQSYVRLSRDLQDIIKIYSLNINVVYVDTLKREYACRSVLILSVDTLPQDQDNLVWLVILLL